MRVVVTRPLRQGAEWVGRLQSRGVDAVALPLIEIEPAPSKQDLAAAWNSLERRRLVMFVSPTAVESFFEQAPPGSAWPPQLAVASAGPGTTAALVERKVAAECIVAAPDTAPQFDSEALWGELGSVDWRGASVLIVRGTTGRNWLATRLAQSGASVEQVAAYGRRAPSLDGGARELLGAIRARPKDHLWLFSSSEAIDHLDGCAGLAEGGGSLWRAHQGIATHPRIAERARRQGFGRVVECRPTLDALVACIQSLQP